MNCLFWSFTLNFWLPASNSSTARFTILGSHLNLRRIYCGLPMSSFDQSWATWSLSDTSLKKVTWFELLLTSFVDVNLSLLDKSLDMQYPTQTPYPHPSLLVWKSSLGKLLPENWYRCTSGRFQYMHIE